MHRGAQLAIVHGAAKESDTPEQLSTGKLNKEYKFLRVHGVMLCYRIFFYGFLKILG